MIQQTIVWEVSVMGKDALQSSLQDPVKESQSRTLGFWNKVMPTATENYMPFEKQLLACDWALV